MRETCWTDGQSIFDVFFWRRTRVYGTPNARNRYNELLPCVAIGARDNAICATRKPSPSLHSVLFCYLRSQANLVAIRRAKTMQCNAWELRALRYSPCLLTRYGLLIYDLPRLLLLDVTARGRWVCGGPEALQPLSSLQKSWCRPGPAVGVHRHCYIY